MLEIARYGGRHRVKGSAAMAIALSLYAGLVIWIYPSMAASVNLDELLQAYPEPMLKALGVTSFATLEGFLAAELYSFAWVLLFGLYTAYAAAGLVADAVEHDRLDLWLALPVRRRRLLLEQYLTLLVPILLVNVIALLVVYAAALVINDPLPIGPLVMVHALSVPYLLCTGTVGLVFGVVFSRAKIAERVAVGTVFGLFLLESLLAETDYEAVGAISPTRYYDVNAILIQGEYDPVAAGLQVVGTLVLLTVAAGLFTRKDLT